MQAPNRAAQVEYIVRTYATPETFISDETRREFLLRDLIPILNSTESAGEWGHLVKIDQANRIPADIIVWKDTREHFDVLTDTGPTWIAHGVPTNPNWVFGPGVPTNPIPSPTPLADLPQILAQLDNLALQNKVLMETLLTLVNRPHPSYTGRVWGLNITLRPIQ